MDSDILKGSLAEDLGISPDYLMTLKECAELFQIKPTSVSQRATSGALVRYRLGNRSLFYICPEMNRHSSLKELARLSETAPKRSSVQSREGLEIEICRLSRDLESATAKISELERLLSRERVHELEAKARRSALLEEKVRDLEARLETESARRLLAERRNDGPRRLLAERQVEGLKEQIAELERERLEQSHLIAEQDFTIERLEKRLQREQWAETKTLYGVEALGLSSCDDEHQGGAVAAETYLSEVGRRGLVSRAKKKVNELVAAIGRE